MKLGRWIVPFAALALVSAVSLSGAADEKMSGEKAKTSVKGGGDVSSKLEANERAVWEAFKSRDANAFMNFVDKDGWSADAMGFAPVSAVPDMMKDYELRSYTLENFKTTTVSKDVYLLTYTAHADASFKGQAMPQVPYYVSTLYANRRRKWLRVNHQESMGMPATPAAGGN